MKDTAHNSNRFATYKDVMLYLHQDYNIANLQEDVVLRHIYNALQDIDLIAVKDYLYFAKVKDFKVKAPCNCYHIKSITAPTYAIKNYGIYYTDTTLSISNTIDVHKSDPNHTYHAHNYIETPQGPYVDYVWQGEYIKFNYNHPEVAIEYTGMYVDEEGYVFIPEDALEAVVLYIVKRHDYAKLRSGQGNPNIYAETTRLYGEAKRKAKASALNKNYMDKVLDVLYSFDRKTYLLQK